MDKGRLFKSLSAILDIITTWQTDNPLFKQ